MQAIKNFQNSQQINFSNVITDVNQGLIVDIWNGQECDREDIYCVADYTLRNINQHCLRYWMIDITQIESGPLDVLTATSDYLSQRVDGLTLEKFAFISRQPNNSSRQTLCTLFEDYEIEVETFATTAMALQWLLVPRFEDKDWDLLSVKDF